MSWYKRSHSSSASIKTAATVFTSNHPRYLGTWTFPHRNDPATLVDIDSIVDFTEPLDFHKTRRGATKKYDQLQKAIERGEKLPPIVVRQIDHGYQLLDGHHRYVATRRAGQSKILASIVEKSNIIDVSHIVEQIKNRGDRDIEKHFEKMYRNHLF